MSIFTHQSIRRARRIDRVAHWTITGGGALVIAGVIAILVLIVSVAFPLFVRPSTRVVGRTQLPAGISAATVAGLGVERSLDGRDLAVWILEADGRFTFLDGATGRPIGVHPARESAAGSLRAVEKFGGTRYSLLWSDGSASLVQVAMQTRFQPDGRRSVDPVVETLADCPPAEGERPLRAWVRVAADGRITRAVLGEAGRLAVRMQVPAAGGGLFDSGGMETIDFPIPGEYPGRITCATMDMAGKTLYAGTDNGCLLRWTLDPAGGPLGPEVVPAFPDKRSVTALTMVFGDASLAVGDARGGLTTWFPVKSEGIAKLRRIHTLEGHRDGVSGIFASQRDKSLLSVGQGGGIHLDHMTSERHLASLEPSGTPRQVAWSARGDALATLGDSGEVKVWKIENPHPEISWQSLFGKVFYEGYSEPVYAWQTTGGDEFEPKFSLVPLLWGTLKGTFYAMLFAVPLALFGAVYTSQFALPALRRFIKPLVEIMAAVPSVVVGFLVALWLAPVLEQWILAVFLLLVTVPLAFALFLVGWQGLRRFERVRRIECGHEFLLLAPVLLLGMWTAWLAAPPLEAWLFGGHFRNWLYGTAGMQFDQRNCVLIAFGLGFAVMPIIFSIAEDALSTVPPSLGAASLSLGASRWQTVWNVVLPSASPGIFAGVMIGLGRAVGETMIVLMATGNTPILDWSPFNGMRTLSANIAVEIPEAPMDGTLYRVLFLCAVLLFALTFVLNTAAELVRQRLRRKYGQF